MGTVLLGVHGESHFSFGLEVLSKVHQGVHLVVEAVLQLQGQIGDRHRSSPVLVLKVHKVVVVHLRVRAEFLIRRKL